MVVPDCNNFLHQTGVKNKVIYTSSRKHTFQSFEFPFFSVTSFALCFPKVLLSIDCLYFPVPSRCVSQSSFSLDKQSLSNNPGLLGNQLRPYVLLRASRSVINKQLTIVKFSF